jgi:hypothetical protein
LSDRPIIGFSEENDWLNDFCTEIYESKLLNETLVYIGGSFAHRLADRDSPFF